jgi:hypothetical protein
MPLLKSAIGSLDHLTTKGPGRRRPLLAAQLLAGGCCAGRDLPAHSPGGVTQYRVDAGDMRPSRLLPPVDPAATGLSSQRSEAPAVPRRFTLRRPANLAARPVPTHPRPTQAPPGPSIRSSMPGTREKCSALDVTSGSSWRRAVAAIQRSLVPIRRPSARRSRVMRA